MDRPFASSMPMVGIDPAGREFSISIRVEAPVQISTGEWGCSVMLPGWDDQPHKILGIDSLHALQLAVRFAEARLESFLKQGGRLLDPETREDWPLEARFPARAAPLP